LKATKSLIFLVWGFRRIYLNIVWFYGLSKQTLNAVQQYQQTITVTQTRKLELDIEGPKSSDEKGSEKKETEESSTQDNPSQKKRK
jgi:hypothetical protein